MLRLVGHQNSGPVTVIKDQDSKNVKATVTALRKIMFWWEIRTNKQCYNFKIIIITSWSVYSEIHYSEIVTISPTFPSTSCQGILRLLYQDGKETVEKKKDRCYWHCLIFQLDCRGGKMKGGEGSRSQQWPRQTKWRRDRVRVPLRVLPPPGGKE